MASAAVAALFLSGAVAAATRTTAPERSGDVPASARTQRWPVATLETPAPAAVPPPAPAPAAPTMTAPPEAGTVMAPPPERFDAPAAAAPAPPLVRPMQLGLPVPDGGGTGTWAVVIGVNDYPGFGNDLRAAVNDADDVDRALAGMGVPAGQRLVLRDGQATAAGIREAVDWLVARAGPDATAVFFYGGHVRKVGLTSEALVGADGALVGDRELGERLARLPARRAWIAVAGCYGGGFTEVLAPGRILTGAAPADALAWESAELGRSFLVEYMVRKAMIEQRAAGSVQAAFSFAVAELARNHPDRVPVQIDLAVAPLDLRPLAPLVATPPVPSLPPLPPTTLPCRRLLLLRC